MKGNARGKALKCKVEKEENNSLKFLDVLVETEGTGFLTSAYRKSTFEGQYIRWNSFSPNTRKTSFIKTLVHRAIMICSKLNRAQSTITLNNCSLKTDIQTLFYFLLLTKN